MAWVTLVPQVARLFDLHHASKMEQIEAAANGIFAPAKTPRPIIQKVNAEVSRH